LPEIDENEIYAFEDIPKIQRDYDQNLIRSYFPIFRVAEK